MKQVWVRLNAERLVYDSQKGKEPITLRKATELSEKQYDHDLRNGELRVSLEELLIADPEELHQLYHMRNKQRIKNFVKTLSK
jgi:hypothetical protein